MATAMYWTNALAYACGVSKPRFAKVACGVHAKQIGSPLAFRTCCRERHDTVGIGEDAECDATTDVRLAEGSDSVAVSAMPLL